MRMLRDFKALMFQIGQMFLSFQMFQSTTKARNYRIFYVENFSYYLLYQCTKYVFDYIFSKCNIFLNIILAI